MRTSAAVVFVCAALAAAPVQAGPDRAFEVRDLGDRVEVVAHGWTAVDPSTITVNRERLELMVAGDARRAKQSYEDATVRRVEVRGRDPRTLSIKLRTEHGRVVKLAPHATATQIGDELHVVIPRAVPRPAPALAAATTTIAAEVPAPVTAPTAPPSTTTAPAPAAATTPATTTPAPAAIAPAPRLGQSGRGATTGRWWMLLGGLVLVGGGITAVTRKRKRAPAAQERIELIDSRAVGGKARVVWLGAGDRELVLAVGPQQVRLLGQWRRNRDAAAEAPAFAPDGPAFADEPRPMTARGSTRLRTVNSSPAVSGILRLRDRPAPLADDIASGDPDADEQWARDILAATGGRR